MGMQFFDVAIYAVGAGGVCLAVYRGLQGEGVGAIWNFPDAPESSATEVLLGAVVGAIAGGVGIAFRRCARSTAQSLSSRLPTQQGDFLPRTEYSCGVTCLAPKVLTDEGGD